jgi:hypothetical protein
MGTLDELFMRFYGAKRDRTDPSYDQQAQAGLPEARNLRHYADEVWAKLETKVTSERLYTPVGEVGGKVVRILAGKLRDANDHMEDETKPYASIKGFQVLMKVLLQRTRVTRPNQAILHMLVAGGVRADRVNKLRFRHAVRAFGCWLTGLGASYNRGF